MTKPFKTCGCGREWTKEEWEALPLVDPRQYAGVEDGFAYFLELRNCPCGSTKAIEYVEFHKEQK